MNTVAATTTSMHRVPRAGEPVATLDRIVATAGAIEGIRTADIRAGDWVIVSTRNSTYSLAVLGDGWYQASGGWFSAQGVGPATVRVAGCTWGGAVIHTGLVAAIGMFLEFDNGVRTTRVREVRVIRGDDRRTH